MWGAFTAGVGGLLIACVHLFFLRTLSLGSGGSILTAIQMRKGIRAYLGEEHVAKIVISLVLFVFVGLAASWLTAVSFLFGSLATLCTAWLCLYIDTYGGLCILCSVAESFEEAIHAMFRSANTVGVLIMSIAIACIAFCYLVLQDIRSLLGVAAGVSTIAFVSRLASTIYSVASSTAVRTIRRVEFDFDFLKNFAFTMSAKIGESVDGTTLFGVDFIESITAAIAVTAISATMLPYVPSNPYVFCVYNHLHIDFGCIAYGNTTQTVLLASEICRQNQFYTQYPSLTFAQSNSIFAVVPFLVGILGLLIVAACSIRFFVPLNLDRFNTALDISNRIRRVARIQTIIAAFLFFLGSVAISYGLFGPRSSFHSGLSKTTFPRREFSTSKLPDKCVPVPVSVLHNTTSGIPSNLPQLNNTLNEYRATNQFGETFPVPNQVPWRMLTVLLLGQVLGFLLEFLISFFSDPLYIPTNTVLKIAEWSIEDVITQGFGSALASTALPFMLTLLIALASYQLLGGYGIALTSASMLAACGVMFTLGIFETLANNSEGVSHLNRLSSAVRSKLDVIGRVGGHYALASRSVYAASGFLVAITLVSDLLLVSKLVPTAKDIIGSIGLQSQRHIRSVDSLTAIDPNVVVSVMAGILLPIILVGLVLLGMARTAYTMIVKVRTEFRQATAAADVTNGIDSKELKKCVIFTTRYSMLEMMLPVSIVVLAPMSIGFGLGQRGLVAFLLSTSSCSYIVSMLLMSGGNSWRNACRAMKDKTSGRNTEADKFRRQAVTVAEDIGYFLSRSSTPGLGIFMKLVSMISVLGVSLMKADNSQWYIGVGLLIFLALVSVVMLIARYKDQKKIQNKARLELENETRSGMRNEGMAAHDNGMNRFYEENVMVERHNVARVVESNSEGGAHGRKED